jgi:sec-independent protein translocase protein TatA
MFGLGPTELIIIAVIILLLFGAKRLPDIGKGLGGAIREFKNVKHEISPEKPSDKNQSNENTPTIESKVVDKVMEKVPGVKEVAKVKKKAEKVKELIK